MLTKKQQIKLILLTSHEKFGQLLADAIETWKYANPCKYDLGITTSDHHTFIDEKNPKCCLLGAIIFNKKEIDHGARLKGLRAIYGNLDFSAMIAGFDGTVFVAEAYHDHEAYAFAAKVSEILFGK